MCDTCKRTFARPDYLAGLFERLEALQAKARPEASAFGSRAVDRWNLSEVLDKAVESARDSDEEDALRGLLSRIETLEDKAERMRLAALLSNGVNTRTVDRVSELGEKSKETDSVLASHNGRTDSLVERLHILEVQTTRDYREHSALVDRVKGLEESLKAQGRQLEELLLWRESVMETADIVADENAMGAIAEAEGDANTVLPGDAEGGDQ